MSHDYRMTPLSGSQKPEAGYAVTGRNKGVQARRRKLRRSQAASRGVLTEPGERRKARCPDLCGHKSHTRPPAARKRRRQAASPDGGSDG